MSDKSAKPKHTKRNVIGIILVAIFIIIIASSSHSKAPTNTASAGTTSTNSKSTSTQTTAVPGLNQQADDGKLGFTITNFQCGVQSIDQPGDTDGMFVSTQGAPYCEMNLTVKGVSTVAQQFDDDSQYIYANGKRYSVDDDASVNANASGDNCTLDPTVNPGTTISCTLVYDVPAGVTPTTATLHDSAYSGGVEVNL